MKETLKELQTRRKRFTEQKHLAEKDLATIKLDVKKLNAQIKEVDALIKVKTKKLTVSEHAILQFAVRYLDLDVDNIKSLILSDSLVAASKNFSKGQFPIGEKMGTAVIKENVIVTII